MTAVYVDSRKTPAFFQVDLDGIWAIRRCYNYDMGAAFDDDPVYTEGLPLLLDFLKKYGVPATLFVAGKDLEIPTRVSLLKECVAQGCEIACHTYNHVIGLGALSDSMIRAEILDNVRIIENMLQCKVSGFRAPGYDVNERIWNAVAESGLCYDASLFSSPWTKVLKRIVNTFITRAERGTRQFGAPCVSPPREPFRLGAVPEFREATFRHIMEFPIALSPWLKLPVQVSYLHLMGDMAFRRTARWYSARGIPLGCIFHGIDFVDTRKYQVLPDAKATARVFFNISLARKLKVAERVFSEVCRYFLPMTMSGWLSDSNNQG